MKSQIETNERPLALSSIAEAHSQVMETRFLVQVTSWGNAVVSP